MARKHSVNNRWLKEAGLKYVTVSKGRYVYRPYISAGKYGPEVPLAPISATKTEVILAYEQVTQVRQDTLLWMLEAYRKRRRAPADVTNYKNMEKWLVQDFGDVPLTHIDGKSIQQYLDYKADHNDGRGAVAGNRNIEHLRAAWNWSLTRFDQVPRTNPCEGVDFNEEAPRDRLITQAEYDAVYEAARSQRTPFLAVMMELAYLCRMRMSETRMLRRADVGSEGILVRRAKGSKDELTLWSDRLRAAMKLARSINRDVISPYVLHREDGRPISEAQFKGAWDRAVVKAGFRVKQGSAVLSPTEFTFHDIKAMGVTHHPTKMSGHKTKKMEAVYDRLPVKTEPTR